MTSGWHGSAEGPHRFSAISQGVRGTMDAMTTLHRRPVLRWLVPATVAVALAGGGSAIGLLSASAGNQLAPRTASQLLVDVQGARVTGLSGTVVQDADLGLPSLPGVGGSGSSDLTSLVSGSHTLRVWSAGADKTRVALLGSLGESDVIRNGDDVWTWSSKDKTATHLTLPAKAGAADRTPADPSMTPQQAADAALKAISPTTKVSTDGTATVAGRPAYELVLQPREASSLVESVRIAVDGKTHVPLRVQAFARGADKPAFQVGFTSFDPTAPADSVFAFNPPPGTKVTTSTLGDHAGKAGEKAGDKADSKAAPEKAGSKPAVVGKGWASVVVADLPASATSGGSSSGGNGLAGVLKSLPKVTGSWGSGHVLRGTLFSAVLTDDGRVAVGAVAPEALYAALAR